MRALWMVLPLMLSLALPLAAQSVDLDQMRTRAEAGDATAQMNLAQVFHDGAGVAQNYAQAAFWAEQAAAQGNATAQNLLGRYAYEGLGVEKNQAAALTLLTAAANQGDPQHIYDLGIVYETGVDGAADPKAAARAYAAAANTGHLDAMVSLGSMMQTGRGVAQDYAQARSLYEAAAKAGHPRAQNNLGLLYVRGHGVTQDYARAATLFEAAAQQGLKRAMGNLGVMYENGFGVPVDEAQAAALYRAAGGAQDTQSPASEAASSGGIIYDTRLQPPPEDESALSQQADNGDPVAQFQLGWRLLNAADPSHADRVRAADLFRAAAQAGHVPAMVNLGVMYLEGQGVAQDYVLGQMWLTLGARSGLPAAQNALTHYAGLATPAQINQAQEMARAHLQTP